MKKAIKRGSPSPDRPRDKAGLGASASHAVVGPPPNTLYYSVFPGNYPKHVKAAFALRSNWQEVSNAEAVDRAHFIWQPLNFSYKVYVKVDSLQRTSHPKILNHMENLRTIGTKTGLVRSLKSYYKQNVQSVECGYTVFDSTPTTFIITPALEGYEYHQFVTRY